MKHLIAGLLLLAGVNASAACVDFTGQYVFGAGSAQESELHIKQASCASFELTSVQKGRTPQTASIPTDGKVQRQENPKNASNYLLESYTQLETGLRIASVYVEDDIFVEISSTMVTKLANGDIQLEISSTDAQGETTLMKVVGTKK